MKIAHPALIARLHVLSWCSY